MADLEVQENKRCELVIQGPDVKRLARFLIDWEIPFTTSGCTLLISSIEKTGSLQYTSIPFTNKNNFLGFIKRKGKNYNVTIVERL